MSLLVDLGYGVAAALYAPKLAYDAMRHGKNRGDWGERFGRLRDLPPRDSRIWIHAVSVGEVNATRGLVAGLQADRPNAEIVISTTTDTGMARARALYPDLYVFRYPLDFSRVVRRALHCIKPTLIVLVELEVWYHLLEFAERAGVPVAVVNGRLSERSRSRFGLISSVARRMFSRLALVAAQDDAIAARFRHVGLPPERCTVTGSLKWDTAATGQSVDGQAEIAAAMGLDTNRPIWVCGSTGPGEEVLLLSAYETLRGKHAGLQLVLVPRKPERFDEVAALVQKVGFKCVRRTDCPDGSQRDAGEKDVFLVDTMGELRKLYALAAVVFVGRSLVPMGGSDPMEVAALAKPTLVGLHTDNFQQIVETLKADGGLEVVADVDALVAAIDRLLNDPDAARAMADAGRATVLANQGATRRTIDALLKLI